MPTLFLHLLMGQVEHLQELGIHLQDLPFLIRDQNSGVTVFEGRNRHGPQSLFLDPGLPAVHDQGLHGNGEPQ